MSALVIARPEVHDNACSVTDRLIDEAFSAYYAELDRTGTRPDVAIVDVADLGPTIALGAVTTPALVVLRVPGPIALTDRLD
jgi:hypothetical protein